MLPFPFSLYTPYGACALPLFVLRFQAETGRAFVIALAGREMLFPDMRQYILVDTVAAVPDQVNIDRFIFSGMTLSLMDFLFFSNI